MAGATAVIRVFVRIDRWIEEGGGEGGRERGDAHGERAREINLFIEMEMAEQPLRRKPEAGLASCLQSKTTTV